MLGSAVSSRTPTDLKPRSPCAVMKRQAEAGVHQGWPYSAVGIHSAVESSIGLPSNLTSASRMLVFVTPPDVRRSFKLPPEFVDGFARGRDRQAGKNSSAQARSSVTSFRG